MVGRKLSVSDRMYIPYESSDTESDFSYFKDSNSGTDCYFLDTCLDCDESEK